LAPRRTDAVVCGQIDAPRNLPHCRPPAVNSTELSPPLVPFSLAQRAAPIARIPNNNLGRIWGPRLPEFSRTVAEMNVPISNGKSGRMLELDALRGLAAVAVMIFHCHRDFWFGFTGIDLFFVLSGYLITEILIRNRRRQGCLRVFYARRAFRILPIYYLVVISVFLINSFLSHPLPTSGYPYHLFYLQNTPHYWGCIPPTPGLPLIHTWTLAIEEQFYLLWPLAVLLLTPARLLCVCVCLVLFTSSARFEGLHAETLLGRMDGLALGAMLACLRARWQWARSPSSSRGFFAIAGAAAVYFIVWNLRAVQSLETAQSFRGNAGILIISIAYFGLIGGLANVAGARGAAWLRLRWLTGLGTISYGLYLYHVVVYAAFDYYFKLDGTHNDCWWMALLKIAVSIGVACLSWYFIEKPILKLKDRFSYGDERREPRPALPAWTTTSTIVYPQKHLPMSRRLTILFQRDPSRDRQEGHVQFTGYKILWPAGGPVGVALDAFCTRGQRLLGLDHVLAGHQERLIDVLCFPREGRDDHLVKIPGHRVRRFCLVRWGHRGRLHFLDGTPTETTFEIGRDDDRVLDWIGINHVAEGGRQWVDIAAQATPSVVLSAVA
jgi:peptidoglycan/LPS O-acetylase OafA/YrhL